MMPEDIFTPYQISLVRGRYYTSPFRHNGRHAVHNFFIIKYNIIYQSRLIFNLSPIPTKGTENKVGFHAVFPALELLSFRVAAVAVLIVNLLSGQPESGRGVSSGLPTTAGGGTRRRFRHRRCSKVLRIR
jgi:hypothetical protein